MADYLTRGFRAQLNTAMESVLRSAVREVMRIFENSLHDHQMELVRKGEEVAHLRIKLQTAEIKLKDLECGGDRRVEKSKPLMNETQREPEVVLNYPGQTHDVPEIDFEVPDDWCAPLGYETVTKQDDDVVCPSIRLRPLLIPLRRIPVIKHEVTTHDIDSHQQTKGVRRSRRGSSLDEKNTFTSDKSSPLKDKGKRRNPVRNNMKQYLLDIKQEYCDQTCSVSLRRGSELTGKKQDNAVKSRREERKIPATESESTEQEFVKNDDRTYRCKFCKKEFDTEFGRKVHVRSHKRCQGCKKEFPFPSLLKCHKRSCKKFKRLLAKKDSKDNPPKPVSSGEEKQPLPSKRVIIKNESSPPSGNPSESSIQKNERHSCAFCRKTFLFKYKLMEHMRLHTGEKPFSCSMCSKKFRLNQALKGHMMRMHQDQMNAGKTNGDLAWTKPLEETDDNREALISPSKDASDVVSHNNVQREQVRRWQTMGVQNSNGFTCLMCHKFTRTKRLLIEHYRIHTGERPIKCERCPAKFLTGQQLYMHKRRCHYPVVAIQCERCKKTFPSKVRYNKHVCNC